MPRIACVISYPQPGISPLRPAFDAGYRDFAANVAAHATHATQDRAPQ
jgi:hypothetical protein